MFEWLESGLAAIGGEGFGAAAVHDVTDAEALRQESLGQSIVDNAIWQDSVNALNDANAHAALAFEGAYDHATAGPAYDPTEADPYGFQTILGRAIVAQSIGTPPYIQDDQPLANVGAADIGAWAKAALGAARDFVTPPQGPAPITGAPRQVFSNRPGQGGGYVLTPGGGGGSVNPAGGGNVAPLLVLGLVAVGAYVALK